MQFTIAAIAACVMGLLRRSPGWVLLGAVAAGLSAGTKYTGGTLLVSWYWKPGFPSDSLSGTVLARNRDNNQDYMLYGIETFESVRWPPTWAGW